MKIEDKKIQYQGLNLQQVLITKTWHGRKSNQKIPLSDLHLRFLQATSLGRSICDFVLGEIQQGHIPDFISVRDLLQHLVNEGEINDPDLVDYFVPKSLPEASLVGGLWDKISTSLQGAKSGPVNLKETLLRSPFFRPLGQEVVDLFLTKARVIETDAGIKVCSAGQNQRSLLVLVKGQCSIYKPLANGGEKKIAVLTDNTVFGEAGFFLNEARTADVVTDTACTIVKISYVPEVFDPLIKLETARQLQRRFWLIHALLKSPLFRNLPEDCLDSLIQTGETRSAQAGQVLCRENELGTSCFVIIQGSLVVLRGGKSVKVISQGDICGEMALLITGGLRTATVQAQSESLLLEISMESFYRLMAQNLFLACEFQKIAASRAPDL